MFSWYPAEVHLVADGQLYIRGLAGYLADLDTGEHVRMGYLPLERAAIERMVSGGSLQLSEYINTLQQVADHGLTASGVENAAELYAEILDAVDRLGSEDFVRVSGTDILHNTRDNRVHIPHAGEDGFRVNTVDFDGEGQFYGVWQPDDETRFIVGVRRWSRSPGLVGWLTAVRVDEDGGIAGSWQHSSNKVSYISPRNIRRQPRASGVLSAYNWQFTDMQVHSDGDVLILTYHNAESDSRLPFARVVYRNGMFEIIAP